MTRRCLKTAVYVGQPMLRCVSATRYVAALREGGSLPGLVEADDEGLYVVKFRGAGQGAKSLVAEIVGGELARGLGLLVPELVLADIDPALVAAEPDPEIQELVRNSAGLNAALDFLPGALAYNPAGSFPVAPELAALVICFDEWVANVDRTIRNPNLLIWHGRLWLIDHGAALYHQHGDFDAVADGDRPLPNLAQHVLMPVVEGFRPAALARIEAASENGAIEAAVERVPGQWLGDDAERVRERYVTYLRRRAQSLLTRSESGPS